MDRLDVAPFVQRRREIRQGTLASGPTIAPEERRVSGCAKCQFGILGDTRTDGPGPLYLLRLFQAEAHTIEFCDCEWGRRYRAYLLARHGMIKAGADMVSTLERDKILAWVEDLPAPEVTA